MTESKRTLKNTQMMTFKDGQRVKLVQDIDLETEHIRSLPAGSLGTVRITARDTQPPVVGVVFDKVIHDPWYAGLETISISVRINGQIIQIIELCEALT